MVVVVVVVVVMVVVVVAAAAAAAAVVVVIHRAIVCAPIILFQLVWPCRGPVLSERSAPVSWLSRSSARGESFA